MRVGWVSPRASGSRLSPWTPRRRRPQRLQDGGHDVHDAHRIAHGARRECPAGHDQRDADGGVVDEEPVQLLLVLAERLAVIAYHHDERVVEPAPRQAVDQPPDETVRPGDLRVVDAVG